MPINDLEEKFGAKVRTARNAMRLTQEQLSDLSHVSTKYIGNIEKGKVNPSLEIIGALAKVLKFSLDEVTNPTMTDEEKACKELAAAYISCPPSGRSALLNSTQLLAKELTELAERMETK